MEIVLRGDSGPGVSGRWIGSLITLGSRLQSQVLKCQERRLVVGISVPNRQLAAALVATGWKMATRPPQLPTPPEVMQRLLPGTPIRAVNSQEVITGKLGNFDQTSQPPRVQFAGSAWNVELISAFAEVDEVDTSRRMPKPQPGSLEYLCGLNDFWDEYLASPPNNLVIVGAVSWLLEDLAVTASVEGDRKSPSKLANIVLPKTETATTWSTELVSASRFDGEISRVSQISGLILDGNSAITWLGSIDAPVTVCILDRSIANETSGELIMQMRNTRGEPTSMSELGWQPAYGVEALSFTVKR